MQAARGKALNTEPAAEPGHRRVGLLLIVAGAVYVADIVSKVVVVATISHRVIHLLGGLLTLRVLRNSGAAFSVGTSMTVVFSLIAAGVIIFILRTSRRLYSAPWAVTLGLLLGGATGNLTDRILRSPGVFSGEVVDWIQLPHWPVFNLADSAIVCGGVLAVLLAARGIRLDGSKDSHILPDPEDSGGGAPAEQPGGEREKGQPARDSRA
jgi:signal peptidase II